MNDMGYFVPHYFHAIDMGVPLILGVEAIYAYDVLRRNVWREERRGGRLAQLYRDGHLVCSLSQASVAEMIGKTPRHTRRLFASLRQHGWVRTFGPVAADSSILVYHLGELVNADGQRGRSGTAEVYFADDWITLARRALTRHLRDVYDDPELHYRDVPFAERLDFVKKWAEETSIIRAVK